MSRRNCRIGKSCGASCITRLKECRIDLISEMSDGMGKVRDTVENSSPEKRPPANRLPEEAKEQYQKDFLNHVEANSAKYSNATFTPRDLANLVVQASNDLEGEAKENLKKLMEFAVKDDQVLFISTREIPKDSKDVKTVRRFAELLDKGYPFLKLNYEENINRVVELRKELLKLKREDRERKAEGLLPLHSQRINRIENIELKELTKKLNEARETVFKANITRSNNEGNWGFTSAESKRIVISDRSSIPADRFVVGERGDARLAARQIKETIDFRASKPKMTDEEHNQTKFVAGRFADGKTSTAYLYVYIHELGHQVDFRSGQVNTGLRDSVSLSRGSTLYHSNRGISKYSTFNEREAFAEAFSAFILNPKALRDHDPPLYNWVKGAFDAAIQNAGKPA